MRLALKPAAQARIAKQTLATDRWASVSVRPLAHAARVLPPAPAPLAHAASVPAPAKSIAVAHAARVIVPRRVAGLSAGQIEWVHVIAAAHRAGLARLQAGETQMVPGNVARILSDGFAAAPLEAPVAVQEAIWAANRLIGMPYVYGGGHGGFYADGYDCSGTVSFALHGGGLLDSPMDSSEFYAYGAAGRGRWITVYTSPGHAFLEIAGIRLDTSSAGQSDGEQGPRWRPLLSDTSGYEPRHPSGY